LKNLVGYQVAETLRMAAELVTMGQTAVAQQNLAKLAALIEGLQTEIAAFERDLELEADRELALTYEAALDYYWDGAPQDVIDSLTYASYRKVLRIAATD
jgi:hypothetical protein